MKRLVLMLAVVTSLILLCQPVQAAELRSSDNVNIPSDVTINDDLYVAGGTVTINGTINGDLIVAGGNVTINGTVRDDAMIAGGTVVVAGDIGQSIRAAGGNLTINGEVGEDLVVSGGNVDASSSSTIGRDVLLASGSARLSGPVGRGVRGAIGSLTIDTRIGNGVRVNVGNLTLTGQAVINGDLVYTSENTADIADGARVTGEITRREPPVDEPGVAGRIFSFIASFIAAFLFGLLLLLLFPAGTVRVADTVRESPWISLLLGFALLIVVPAAIIILLILVVTIPISLAILFFYVLGIYLAKVFVGLALGRTMVGYFKWNIGNILAFLIGLAIVMLLGLIPFIGPLVRFVYIIFGLGAAGLVIFYYLRERSTRVQE